MWWSDPFCGRLNISSIPSQHDTSDRRGVKRQRVSDIDTPSAASYVTKAKANAGIEIRDIDAKFIRLYNHTNKVIIVKFVFS